jgi:hypothetical protein
MFLRMILSVEGLRCTEILYTASMYVWFVQGTV